jgi:hypothetical protein
MKQSHQDEVLSDRSGAITLSSLHARHARNDGSYPFTQLASMVLPCSVSTDSGWNCTPRTS